ncbi:hypothetical protein HD806DRAFT_335790 [Xylariaceae sp. AK1471]|nr:hypothetical protein HD806DRAFT_335790 [Xylariaceae sp. AK1471]
MEALAAVALAGNVAQFLEFSITAVSKTAELLRSADGTLKEMAEVKHIVDAVKQSFESIRAPNDMHGNGVGLDKTLKTLTENCLAVSDEIMAIVDGLKLKDPGAGIMQGAAKVTKSLSKKSKLKELSERLYALRDQVSAHLIILIREQQLQLGLTLQNLMMSSEEFQVRTEAKLQEVIDYLRQISEQTNPQQTANQGIHSRKTNAKKANAQQAIRNNVPAEHERPLGLARVRHHLDDYVSHIRRLTEQKQKSILQGLYFSQLKDREFAIAEAHRNTLEWIFQRSSSTNYVKWLQEDNGIYWVAGKAGSGKSTLMKFLTDHPFTIHHLREWAGQKPLVIAKHYFWSPGASIQKSQEGLFRSLLLQILNERTDLIPTVCVSRWNAPYANVFNPWSRAEMVSALMNLGTMDEAGCKICLFIDGLDEYDGDHAQLVSEICRIGESMNIKICASSRPWLDFSDAFGSSSSKLRLEDLTRRDIRRFVQDNLQDDTRFNRLQKRNVVAADELISEITERASGVFLWVFLVVRSILRGLRNEDTISDLQRRLRELPVDLQEYFDRMLSAIEDVYRKRVSRLFLTMTYAQTTFPVITFYFMDFGDEHFSTEPLPFLREWPNVDPTEAEALSTKKRQLIAQCRDLIYITPDPDAPVLFAERVGFLHRTVVDFLHTADVEEKLLRLAGDGFNPTNILLRACLGQARSLMHLHRLTYIMAYLRQWILGTLYYAHEIEVSSGNAEVDALDELESIIKKAFSRWDFSHAMECIFNMPEIASFLELACRCDLASYVSHKVTNCTSPELDTVAPGWREPLKIKYESNFEICAREITKDAENEWRVGHMAEPIRSAEEGLSFSSQVITRDHPHVEQYGSTRIKGRGLSKLARVFNRLRS